MKAEYAVINILLNTTAVTAIVGTRIYLDEAPQSDSYPLIIISEEGVEPGPTKSGVSAVDRDIIRVFPYATNKNDLRLLAQACRDALDGKAAGTYNSVAVEDIMFQGQTSFDETIVNRKVYAKDQQYSIRVNL
jgi:hypothetical protein